jgi:monooxygenase
MPERSATDSGTTSLSKQETDYFDILVVGAGLSGIVAGYYLQTECPSKSFAILEARDAIGGTWDLFRYPGIRSDSDIYTFGFSFSPWRDEKAMADGALIHDYLHKTVADNGLNKRIHLKQKVIGANWNSDRLGWDVDVLDRQEGVPVRYKCKFLYLCTGYYDFEEGYLPSWPGVGRFKGRLIHPQHWPEDLDYTGSRVVIVGSGATAVTLVPAMAQSAAHVTMLQRSPSYIVALPAKDRIANWLRRNFPAGVAHGLARWKNILLTMFFYNMARIRPNGTKKQILRLAKQSLPPEFEAERHLSPRYNPWDQRLCLVPDGDLFAAIQHGRASVVTGEIDTFTETGIRLRSGEELKAGIVVTATGLKLKLMGGMQLTIDGRSLDLSKLHIYKGMMLSNVPNFVFSMGYTNASWTLKCELIARHFCRIVNHMQRRDFAAVIPEVHGDVGEAAAVSLTSGYILRGLAHLPKQGTRKPWKLYQNYALDLLSLRYGSIENGALRFIRLKSQKRAE